MIRADKDSFKDIVKSGRCLIEFSAPWCPDCRRIEPIISELESIYSDITFVLLDFDSNEEIRGELNIRKIPTLIFYNNGKEVGERLIEPDNKLPIQKALDSLR